MCWGSAGWASVLRHRGEWSRSVSSIPNGAGAEWCYECGAFLCGSQRMEVVEGQWVLLDTTNGGGVYGAVRATMVVQFAMGAMVLDQLGRGFGAAA